MELMPENNANKADNGGTHREDLKNTLNGDASAREMIYLSKLAAVNIEFKDLTYSVPSGRKDSLMILRGISGQFKSNELTAILGPSGAGKSTLLNILAGYNCINIGGSIDINGQPRNMQEFKRISCYIMQDDLVQTKLTVYEAMSFVTDLKLGRIKTRSEKCIAIDEILTALKLSTARDTLVDTLSGGERKRLSIALELVNNPPIIFLDEPTTGLDELASTLCIDLLKKLAKFGRTIVCSIHTPSSNTFKKFDHVYVMAAGHCAYRGTASNVVPYLQSTGIECPTHYNPADFIIEISSGDYGYDLTKRVISFLDTKCPILPISQSKCEFEIERKDSKVLWMDQFGTLLRRKILQLSRDKTYVYLKIYLHILLGGILGGIFFNTGNDGSKGLYNFGFCFTCTILFLYMPMFPTLIQFSNEIRLIKREHFNRWYRLSAYYWTLTVVSVPQQTVSALIYLTIAYLFTGQPLEWQRCSKFFCACLICAFISESIGYSVASIFNSVNSIFMGPLICAPIILIAMQNFGLPYPQPLYRTIIMYTSYLRYALEAILAAVYDHDRERLSCPLQEEYCHFSSPKEIFRTIGMESAPNYWLNIIVLVIILFITKGIHYYLMRQRMKPNKIFQMFQIIGKNIKSNFNT